MIRLRRKELRELATAYMIANTPTSLFNTLRQTDALKRLRDEVSSDELLAFFDRVTARAKRSEIGLAIAYASMLALLLKPDGYQRNLDSSRLLWGEKVEEIARASNVPTRIISLDMTPKPITKGTSSSANSFILVD